MTNPEIPLCTQFSSELWFPDPYDFRKSGVQSDNATRDALQALKICNACPLFANGECLELALSDTSSIDFGIYGGTLASERRKATGSISKAWDGEVWQSMIRREADKIGLVKPYIPKRDRPIPRNYDQGVA
jgi:hypothetical protein